MKETNLPAITLGSSKNLLVGEWVVAVGNPFSLSSTVTAGIVSAKGRRINIVEDKFPIESFIQTDAAINPGNSGGALVNRAGDPSESRPAILSRTGSYTGYAFAIPVDIAKKVVQDLIQYGVVQKAFFGGDVDDYDYQNASKYRLESSTLRISRAYCSKPTKKTEKSAPPAKPDLSRAISSSGSTTPKSIRKVNSRKKLSYHYPGDKITITYIRDATPDDRSTHAP